MGLDLFWLGLGLVGFGSVGFGWVLIGLMLPQTPRHIYIFGVSSPNPAILDGLGFVLSGFGFDWFLLGWVRLDFDWFDLTPDTQTYLYLRNQLTKPKNFRWVWFCFDRVLVWLVFTWLGLARFRMV